MDPFRVAVSEAQVEDLRRRLRTTRWPDQVPGPISDYGVDRTSLRELCDYWASDFDWRRAEAEFNAWPQYLTTIDGQQIHFIHAKSSVPNATPLLMCHGWPGGVFEFFKILPMLTDPSRFGADDDDAFDVVCPSLPGFGWSGPTTETGWDTKRMAGAFRVLMEQLGYPTFGAQGGDWGSAIAIWLATDCPEAITGIHLNAVVVQALQPTDADLSETEQATLAASGRYASTEQGYIAIQRTKPQTLAYALNDSPAGLAAWIAEKYWKWTDHGGTFECPLSRDEILTGISTYWFTETAGSSARLYLESARAGTAPPPQERIAVPVGAALFPRELYRPSRRHAERHYNIQRWTEMPHGGHFAAWEQPEALAADTRAFFRAIRHDRAGT